VTVPRVFDHGSGHVGMGSGRNADMVGRDERRRCCFRGECRRGRQGFLAALPYLTPEKVDAGYRGVITLGRLRGTVGQGVVTSSGAW
jgi:hypothetical protein